MPISAQLAEGLGREQRLIARARSAAGVTSEDLVEMTTQLTECDFTTSREEHQQRYVRARGSVTATEDLELLERVAHASLQWVKMHDMIKPVSWLALVGIGWHWLALVGANRR